MKNNCTRHIAIAFALLLYSSSASAQMAEWLVKPGRYDEIIGFSRNLYRTEKDGVYGLLDHHGSEIVSPKFDQITDFANGYAFILRQDAQGVRVYGHINGDNGEVTTYEKPYIIADGMVFFNDGLMPVNNGSGKYGFINMQGKLVLDYQYTDVLPFCEGFAGVWIGDKFMFIDKSGGKLHVSFPNGGIATSGANFNGGKGFICDDDDIWYTIDAESKLKRTSKQSGKTYDYLGRIGTSESEEVDYKKMSLTAEANSYANIKKITTNGLVGYNIGSKTILPPQLTYGSDFSNDLAVARMGEKVGLLHIVDRQGLVLAKEINPSHTISSRGAQECRFKVMGDETLSYELFDGSAPIPLKSLGRNEYSFQANISGGKRAETKTYSLKAMSDGLYLGEAQLTYKFTQKSNLTVSLSVNGQDADVNGHVGVTATIHNPNDFSVTTEVSLTGSDLFHPVTTTLTIPASDSKSVSSFFNVTHAAADQWVRASTSEGGSATKTGLQLIPN